MRRHPRLRRLAAPLLLLALAAPPAGAAPRFRPASDDVFYMYMPIAWRDSDADTYRFGDFGGMTAAIPYLKSLGVTAVWMTPVFVSPAYHGYQHGPADSINPRLGNESQFLAFVQAAHAESLKVFIDFVAYGISQNTAWFQGSYGNPASPYDTWLAYTNAGNTSYLGCCPYTTWDGGTVGFIHWDLRNPAVTAMITGWARHWLDPDGDGDPADGIDGFRLDHVSAFNATESPWGYDLAWWQAWKSALQSVNPDVFTFAEQADWGSYGDELFPAFDAAMTKPFEFAARSGLASGDAAAMSGAMASTMERLQDGRLFLATLGDHDVNRLATDLGDVPGRLRAAADVLMLQPLPPVIYFGDELGMRGAKNTGYAGDAADLPFREPFKWNAVAGPPMSNYLVPNAAAYAGRIERDHDGRSVEEQSGVPGSLLERYRALAALRHAHPALRGGRYFPVGATPGAVWTFVKVAEAETLLVAVNLGPLAVTATLDLSGLDPVMDPGAATDVESGAALAPITAANRSAYALPVGAYSHRVVRVSLGPIDLRRAYADARYVVTQDSPLLSPDHTLELDQMYVRFDPAGLALGITGNLAGDGNALTLFFDVAPGGQGTLQTSGFSQPPSVLPGLSGMTLDAGFAPDFCLSINNYAGITYGDFYTLASAGGGVKRWLGSLPVGRSGPFAGGDNPRGLVGSYSPSNRDGLASGSAAGAGTATDGFRILVPWADLGLAGPGPPLKLMAMLTLADGFALNQFLPGANGLASMLGYAPFDLNDVPGQQVLSFVNTTAVDGDAPPPRVTPRVTLAGANPARGAVRVRFERAGDGPARLELLDVAGRAVAAVDLGARSGRAGEVTLAGGGALAPGLYFVRLRDGRGAGSLRVAVVR